MRQDASLVILRARSFHPNAPPHVTYLQFLVLFIVPPVLILGGRARRELPTLGRRARVGLLALPLFALIYTTVWDNYLVYAGVWTYGEGRVIGTIGWVPVEEYLFFLLQPLLTGSLLYIFVARLLNDVGMPPPPARPGRVKFWGAVPWLALIAEGLVLLPTESGRYLGLILVWAAPLILILWLAGSVWIWSLRAAVIPTLVISTLYLWFADRTAIAAGTWTISERFTLGFEPWGLPVEEAVFFLVTNLLVVFGLVLVLVPGFPHDPEAAEPPGPPLPA